MKKIINSIRKYGFYENSFEPSSSFYNFAEYIFKLKIPEKTVKNEEKGYSNELTHLLDRDKKKYIEEFAREFFLKNNWLNKILFYPRILKIEIFKAEFNDIAKDNPTHAMLWHRDFDDFFPQIKVFFPLQKVNIENGALCYAEKSICKINEIFVDEKLTGNLKFTNDFYRAEDKLRVSNEVFLKHFKKKTKIFEGNIGNNLFVDTNSCYHRGGQILKKGLQRNMMVISYGGITHRCNNFSSYTASEKIKVKVLQIAKSIQLKFTGGVYRNKIFLN